MNNLNKYEIEIPSNISFDSLYDIELVKIMNIITVAGYKVWIVGGAVRNVLLGISVKDVDVATDIKPEILGKILSEHNIKFVPTGIEHGTITVILNNKIFEVTTLRKDLLTDGRRAKVSFLDDIYIDAKRRDFTINALYLSSEGRLYDPLNSYKHILEKKLCFIGNPENRIKEDALRILRFFRINSQLEFRIIEQESLNACVKNKDLLNKLSSERIQKEIIFLLNTNNPITILRIMIRNGICNVLDLDFTNLNYLSRFLDIEKELELNINTFFRLYVLLGKTEDKKSLSEKVKVLKLSNDKKKYLLSLVQGKLFSLDINNLDLKKIIYNRGKGLALDTLLLGWIFDNKKTNNLLWKDLYFKVCRIIIPDFPIHGSDLIEVGFLPGKYLGEVLSNLENYWINKNFEPTKDNLLKEATKYSKAT